MTSMFIVDGTANICSFCLDFLGFVSTNAPRSYSEISIFHTLFIKSFAYNLISWDSQIKEFSKTE